MWKGKNFEKEDLLLCLLFFILFFSFFWINKWLFPKKLEKKASSSLTCPIRGDLKTKKYDIKEGYTEEYKRIVLINFFLKKGFQRSQILVDYSVPLGHKGRRYLRVDLVIRRKKENKFLLVVEVKKKYEKATKQSAIHHQLIPAMLLLRCNNGLYYDGSKHSCYISLKDNGEIRERSFVPLRSSS